MGWYGLDNVQFKAYHGNNVEELHNKNLNFMYFVKDDSIKNYYGIGCKKFIVTGVGYCLPAVRDLVFANSLDDCKEIFKHKYIDRLLHNKTLFNVRYYKLIEGD